MKLRDFVNLYDNWNGILKVKLRLLCPMEMSMKRKSLHSVSMTTNFA